MVGEGREAPGVRAQHEQKRRHKELGTESDNPRRSVRHQIHDKAMTSSDRTTVTLDRREVTDRRVSEQRTDDRRTVERRSNTDRRVVSSEIDFEDRRSGDRRKGEDRREDERRKTERRQDYRRGEENMVTGISDEEFNQFDKALVSRTQRLAQLLLLAGLIWLLTILARI